MKKYFEILDLGVMTLNKNIAVAGISLGVLLAFTNVVLRYFFEMSITWAGELTNYLFMWSALFGAAYGFKKGVPGSANKAKPKCILKCQKGIIPCCNCELKK